jgi:hypothetical protein
LFFAFARSFLKKKFLFNLCPEGALYEGSRGEDLSEGKGIKNKNCYLEEKKQRG